MSVFLYLGLKLLLSLMNIPRDWDKAHRIAIKLLQNYFVFLQILKKKKMIFRRLRIRTKVDVALSI